MDLKDHLKDVVADSSTAEEHIEEPVDDVEVEGGESDDKKTRTPDQVRGELLRKMEKSESRILDRLDRLAIRLDSVPAPVKAEGSRDKTDIAQYTLEELEGLKRTLDWSKISTTEKDQFESLLTQKRVDASLDRKFSVFTEGEKLRQERQKFGQMAVNRYPQLMDFSSEFARRVNAQLTKQPKEWIANNPRAVYDIANDVATDLQIKPVHRRSIVGGRTAPTDTSPANRGDDDYESRYSDDQEKTIAAELERIGALPKGKKFNLENIKKRRKDQKNLVMVPSSKDWMKGNF